jgi:uncharacterized protein YgiM (DUF1202 family)
MNLYKKVSAVLMSTLSATAFAAAQVEAKKDGVDIYKEATNKSAVVESLKKGDAVESVERQGMYWQVKTKSGGTGFVSVLAVTHKPDSAGASLAKAIQSAVKEGRSTDSAAETRARSAVMGVRGLAADDDTQSAGNVRPNMRSVYAMEDRVVAQVDVEKLGDRVFAEIAKKSKN